MSSPLDFGNSEFFRERLTKRNLIPYKKSKYGNTPPFTYEVSPLSDYSVKDSDDTLIDTPKFANEAYNLNSYGNVGGYKDVTDPWVIFKNKSNIGEYIKSFTPLDYTLNDIILNNTKVKSDLKNDSYIARLSYSKLTEYINERVGRITEKFNRDEVVEKTISSINDPFDVYNLIINLDKSKQPTWVISKSNNIILAATQVASEFGGIELPFSPIVGSYFDESISLNGKYRKGIIFNQKKSGSQLFFDNMGVGQKSVLFNNIKSNLYQPNYRGTFTINTFSDLFRKNNSLYYVGDRDLDITDITGPDNDIPVDQFGRKVKISVYGPTDVSNDYEGDTFEPLSVFNGVADIEGGSIEGGLTWVSPKYNINAGDNVGKGGEVYVGGGPLQSSFESNQSTRFTFKKGSILDDTQRIINSIPSGPSRFKHVGNAIDQVSKVFNDGYKEITKGSRVRRYQYTDPKTLNGGSFQEYCRLFTKDSPYMTHNRLQKKNGITNQGRRLKGSVIENTYDLSMYPKKGNDSKKYMLSLENLAWRTSDKQLNLPECEKGPNGGRIMWFPPYDLKFTESSSPTWSENEFLGRPEPVYTYKNTRRTGSIEFNIIVDHPSVLNVITNQILKNDTSSENINNIINSFIAGCLIYDIYDLAKIYSTIKLDELQELQTIIRENKVIKEDYAYIQRTVTTNLDPVIPKDEPTPEVKADTTFEKYVNIGLYFDNDIPKLAEGDYNALYNSYTANPTYNNGDLKNFMDNIVIDNFNEIKNLANDIKEFNKNNPQGKITITLASSASKPGTTTYNKSLSEKRNAVVKKYLETIITEKNITYDLSPLGEVASVTPKSSKPTTTQSQVNCTNFSDDPIKSVPAMACRRVAIAKIVAEKNTTPPTPNPAPITPTTITTTSDVKIKKITTDIKQEEISKKIQGKDVSKKILQNLLTECDYFDVIKETDPFIYDNLKSKFKYFNPAFHSTTPEGLNSRLTFLQQCVRPGDTIPTIDKSGGLSFKDSKNTSFGIPPVLILRVGDFYHTKIIPDTLSLSYENLDINPEGIGLQPMIAKVQLSFKFVGGHGLSNAIDQLQNALSYNYYANTEVYEPNAETTDFSLVDMDKELYDFYLEKEKVIIDPTSDIKNTHYSLIGELNTNGNCLDYKNFLTKFKEETNKYIDSISSLMLIFEKDSNFDVLQYMTSDMYFIRGEITQNNFINLLGVPNPSIIKKIENYYDNIVDNIRKNDDDFINAIKNNNLDKTNLTLLKNRYESYIFDKKETLITNIDNFINQARIIQATYLTYLNNAGLILSTLNGATGYDFQVLDDNTLDVYKLTGNTTTISTFINSVGDVLNDFYSGLIETFDYSSNSIGLDQIFFTSKYSEQRSLVYSFLYHGFEKNEELTNFREFMFKTLYKPDVYQEPLRKTQNEFYEYWEKEQKFYKIYNDDIQNKNKINSGSNLRKYVGSGYKSKTTKLPQVSGDYCINYIKLGLIPDDLKTALLYIKSDSNYDSNVNKWSTIKDGIIYIKNNLY
jgi:hypothetical protein